MRRRERGITLTNSPTKQKILPVGRIKRKTDMVNLKYLIISLIVSSVVTVAFYRYAPLSWFETQGQHLFGSTITTINGSDTLSSSRTTINNNFANLNAGKAELSGSNSYTGLNQFANASSSMFSCYGTCWFGASATSSFSTAGALTLVTPLAIASGGTNASSITTSNGILAYDGTRLVDFAGYTLTSLKLTATNASTTSFSVNGNEVSGERYPVWFYATTTAWVGTSTVNLVAPFAGTLNDIQCSTDTGTLNVQLQVNAVLITPLFNASTTKGTVTFTGSNTFVRGDNINLNAGTPASSPFQIYCTGRAIGY